MRFKPFNPRLLFLVLLEIRLLLLLKPLCFFLIPVNPFLLTHWELYLDFDPHITFRLRLSCYANNLELALPTAFSFYPLGLVTLAVLRSGR